MSTTIDAPGLAKVSRANLFRDLHNERQRKLRRLKRERLKFAGLQALKIDLQPYLQPGDYEHIEDRLQREVTQNSKTKPSLLTVSVTNDTPLANRVPFKQFNTLCSKTRRAIQRARLALRSISLGNTQ